MSKYRSKEAPVPGSSVSETHPLYWADHIQLERKITSRWNKNYGDLYNECKLEPWSSSCSSERKPPEYVRQRYESTTEHGHVYPPDRQVTPSEPTAFLKMHMLKSDHQDSAEGWSPVIEDETPADSSDYQRVSARAHYSVRKPNMYCDYSTPGNTQKHHVIKDPVTSYSVSFGHHSIQFKQNSSNSSPHQEQIETYTSAPDYLIQNGSCPYECVKYDYPSSAMPSDLGRCPECLLSRCTCVPRRRQKIPEDSESRPWSPQIRRNRSYCGDRCTTEGDILRLRLRLSRDP